MFIGSYEAKTTPVLLHKDDQNIIENASVTQRQQTGKIKNINYEASNLKISKTDGSISKPNPIHSYEVHFERLFCGWFKRATKGIVFISVKMLLINLMWS